MPRYRVGLLLVLLAVVLPLGPCPVHAAPRTDTVLLLHTNDIHDNLRALGGRWGGLVYVSGYLHRARAQRPDVLALDAGDICEKGDMLGVVSEGRMTHRAVAAAGFDAGAPGNHEGAYGVARWKASVDEARFPAVACNVVYQDDNTPVVPAFREFTVDGVRVGVIGLGNSLQGTLAGRKVRTLTAQEAAPRVAELAKQLKARDHLVIVVGHWGSAECRKVAAVAPDVDVFVSGHTHELLPEPLVASPSGALIVQTGDYAQRVGEVELTVDLDTHKVVSYRGRLVRLDHSTTPLDKALDTQLTQWNQALCPEALEIVAHAPLSLPMSRRSGEPAPLTRWVAEAMRAQTDADVAAFTNTMLRHDLRAGAVSGDDLFKTVVNRDRRVLCEAEVSGTELLAAVEKLLARSDARGLALAGLRIQADVSRFPGQRVVSADIDPTKRYRLVVPVMLGREGRDKWLLGVPLRELPYTVYEAAVGYARERQTIRLKAS